MSRKINLKFNKNEDNMKLLISDMKQKKHIIELGGGERNISKQHKKGKLTARERIKYLLDEESNYIELGTFAAMDLYENFGGCPAAGVIVVIGEINKKSCIIVANDSTVKSRAWFPTVSYTHLRAHETLR